ncbi:plant UBX domain-containing protein 5-like isoform X1 [Zea mays]|uniref:Plant UBX domain-containing protein 4 n=1 Tax=Zea mays TaxID=4577 RepID=A0A804UJM9_MAIZE|nr:uncharacterized protein LOC100272579 isoform X1 [Zea mays]|eukprot:XP_008658234.1 uncharacterized protein LOC100272579 isoform X1 [Zea mays]
MAAGDAGRAPTAAAAQSLVESFCGVTSATPQEAAFYLESHNWALESAVRSYYDSVDGEADAVAADPVPPPPAAPAGGGEDTEDEDCVVGGGGGGDDDEDDEDYVDGDGSDDEDAALAAEAAEEEERRRPFKRLKRTHDARGGSGSSAKARGNVRTLADLDSGKGTAGSDENSEDDDEWTPPPEYETRDRSRRKNNTDEIFKQAKKKGAKQERNASQPPEEITHNIHFWRNGFTVNDGPLRSFDDPANAPFLKSIKDSDCPTELVPADEKSIVNVNLVRTEEEFTEPVKRAAPFEGERRNLMEPSDNNTSNAAAAAAASSSATASRTITVDDSLPSTSLQIRFADGSRLVARFNTSHRISDVRAFIDATRPGASDYTLQAGFPPKPLEDTAKTIEEAGVANSVIIQSV